MEEIKVISNNNMPTIDYHKLKDLQKGFKVIDREGLVGLLVNNLKWDEYPIEPAKKII